MSNQTLDIVETATSTNNFNTLLAAAQAAGLVDALKSEGPLTVFAPTDAAFNKLEESKPGTIASLLLPESKEALAGILKYHVVPGKVQVNDANVIQTDIECSNGVIHVIDSVILPN